MSELFETIKQLEISLFQSSVRNSTDLLDKLIADDFKEFMSTGETYDKSVALTRLPNEEPLKIQASEFEVRELSENAALITYRSSFSRGNQPTKHSLRSSVWQKVNGQWQIVFHQGTLCRE